MHLLLADTFQTAPDSRNSYFMIEQEIQYKMEHENLNKKKHSCGQYMWVPESIIDSSRNVTVMS